MSAVVVFLAVVVFPLFWIFICWALSVMGGWSRLAERFRAPIDEDGESPHQVLYMQSGQVGWVNYNGCLILSTSPAGLRVSVWPMFRFAHPTLVIPWTAFENQREKRQLLFLRYVRTDVRTPAGKVTITLPAKVFGPLT